jgi:hypothetical protein
MVSVSFTICSKIDGLFLEESQIAICDNPELGIELRNRSSLWLSRTTLD